MFTSRFFADSYGQLGVIELPEPQKRVVWQNQFILAKGFWSVSINLME